MKKSSLNPKLATTKSRLDLKRRDFFTLLGGGIAVYLSSRNPSELLALPLVRQREVPEDFNAFLTIHEDGTVICHVGKIEMGQGPITSLPQQVADELDVSIESIKMVLGDTARCSYDAGTWSDDEFLDVVSQRLFNYFLMFTDNLGFAVDRSRLQIW